MRLAKYEEQTLRKVRQTTVAVIGLGALGSSVAALAGLLGFKKLILIDRDIITIENLGTTPYFKEEDTLRQTFKAERVGNFISQLNNQIELAIRPINLSYLNAEKELMEAEILLDGLDNFRTRFLVNEVAVKLGKPYIYAGTAGEDGVLMPILPSKTACLRCLIPELPKPGEAPTCADIGMDPLLVQMIAGLEVDNALRLIADETRFEPFLYRLRANPLTWEALPAPGKHPDCPTCSRGQFPILKGLESIKMDAICGSDSVQVFLEDCKINLSGIEETLRSSGFQVSVTPYFLRAIGKDGIEFSIFPHGKVIMKGSDKLELMEKFIASYIGT